MLFFILVSTGVDYPRVPASHIHKQELLTCNEKKLTNENTIHVGIAVEKVKPKDKRKKSGVEEGGDEKRCLHFSWTANETTYFSVTRPHNVLLVDVILTIFVGDRHFSGYYGVDFLFHCCLLPLVSI